MTAVLSNDMAKKKYCFTRSDYAIVAFAALLTVCIIMPVFVSGVYASNVGGIRTLTDMFKTQTFRGSAEALSKSNFISVILHYVISWFSFIGLCLTLYQKFITLLYLSARNLFDNIYDIKVNKMKGAFLGYKDLLSSLFVQGENGNNGGGIDVFITFFYSLLPNVKAYSDYCPDKLRDKLDENDGPTQYMLKTAIPTIMLVFFLTIGYSGTLAQAYGTVVDGMAVAADNLVSRNLAGWVKKTVGEGGGYNFSLSASGTEGGKYAQKVAEEIYHQILGLCNNTTTEFQQNLGRIIEETVYGSSGGVSPEKTIDGVSSILGTTATGSESLSILASRTQASHAENVDLPASLSEGDIKNLKSPSVYISISKEIVGDAGLSYSVNKILTAAGAPQDIVEKVPLDRYIHILTYMNVQSNTNYQIPIKEEMTIE